MKEKLLALIAILTLMFSCLLIYHVFSEDTIEISQGDGESEDTTDNVMNEVNEGLLNEDDEIEIGEMI